MKKSSTASKSKKKGSTTAKRTSSKKSAAKKPGKKLPFRPDTEKVALMRQTMVTTLWKYESLPPDKVKEILSEEIAHHFSAEFPDYYQHVNELLMRHNLIEEVPGKKPVHIRLVQRLD